ncbi:MAG: phytanoyl-CoA dioxygenase family protein [Acidimicrobiales bacterium]
MGDRNAHIMSRIDALTDDGRFDEAISVLREAVSSRRDVELEAALLQIRHRAFAETEFPPGPDPWPRVASDRFGEGSLPEVAAGELTAEIVRAALLHHGALMVRGLVDHARASELRATIDAAFEAAARLRENPDAETSPSLVPFVPEERYPFGIYERAFANFGSGVLGVDSPAAMWEMTEALEAAGMRRVFEDYFGESAAFSVKKTTLRRTEPETVAGWHQDGAFLGTGTRALNVWTALTPCGIDAPSLDVFVQRFDHLVPTGGPEIYDWSVSDETAATYDTTKIVRPVFDTGDALLFDQMTLHRTGVDPAMTSTRYAIEMWFFAPSTYPLEQIPIVF